MLLTATALASLVSCALPCRAAGDDEAFDAAVRADWAMQERRYQRTADSPAAITNAYQRARALSRDLLAASERLDLKNELAWLDSLGGKSPGWIDSMSRQGLPCIARFVQRRGTWP